jgi:hypothetical protein
MENLKSFVDKTNKLDYTVFMDAIKALGGKHALGTSPVCEAEKAALKAHKERLEAIGVIDSEAKAKEYRAALAIMFPNLKRAFNECGLDF